MTKEEYESLPEPVKDLCLFLDACMGGNGNIVGLISMSNQVMPVYQAGIAKGMRDAEKEYRTSNYTSDQEYSA